MSGERHISSARMRLAWMLAATVGASACVLPGNGPNGSSPHPTAAFFTPAQAWMGRPFYPRRVAEQADVTAVATEAERLKFMLETDAIHYRTIGSDQPKPARHAPALPMGIVNGELAVLTTRCLIDYKYPVRDNDTHFRNLAIFNSDGRTPRTVFMLSPVEGRPDLTDSRNPDAHWFFDNAFYLNGAPGSRYFGQLVPGRIPALRRKWG